MAQERSRPWIAYESDETGHREVYLARYPDPAGKQQVSAGGGLLPFWRGDGAGLFYTALDGWLVAVPVSRFGQEPTFATPQRLFHYDRSVFWPLVGASADGQRFLVASRESREASPLQVIIDWPLLVRDAGE